MSWFSDMFTGGAADLVDSIGGALDELITSDDERLAAKNKMQALVNDFKVKTLDSAAQYDKEVTTRHQNDMQSDSWLSKNIRPLILAITAGTVYILAYLTVFTTMTELQVRVLEGWVPMLVGLLGVMVTFYFGSRGFEKVKKISNK